MPVFMENPVIQMTYTEAQDLPFVIAAERDQENAAFVGQWSLEQHVNALSDGDIRHLIVKHATGQFVGYVIMKGLANPNDSIELMRITIAQKGHGHGKNVLSLIKTWCFEIQHAHRLWLDVREHNTRAQHVYEAQGFKREGMLRECVKVNGGYQSLVVMSILSQDYYGR